MTAASASLSRRTLSCDKEIPFRTVTEYVPGATVTVAGDIPWDVKSNSRTLAGWLAWEAAAGDCARSAGPQTIAVSATNVTGLALHIASTKAAESARGHRARRAIILAVRGG